MEKFKVVLDFGEERTVEADVVTTDPSWVQFHTRAVSGKPAVLKAAFPARTVSEIINMGETK